jgi:hypothetical protein
VRCWARVRFLLVLCLNVTHPEAQKFWFLLSVFFFSFSFIAPDLGTIEMMQFLPKRFNENIL